MFLGVSEKSKIVESRRPSRGVGGRLEHDAFAGLCFCSGRARPCQGAAHVASEMTSFKNSTGKARAPHPGARHAQAVATALDMSGQPMLSTRAKYIRALHNGFSQLPLRVDNRGHERGCCACAGPVRACTSPACVFLVRQCTCVMLARACACLALVGGSLPCLSCVLCR